LKINAPNDKYEQEAHQIAGEVMRMPGDTRDSGTEVLAPSNHSLQRKCSCGGTSDPTGECEECSKKKRLGLQTKLRVNEPGDRYEQEADEIADQVLATPSHSASSAPPRIQRFAGQPSGQLDAAPDSVNHALANPGRPLELALREDMEQRFGCDFSRVRLHSGAAAEQSARDVNAHAYTVGQDMVFGAGRFAPGTQEGRWLIAHELTHVVQQSDVDRNHVSQSNEKRGLPPIIQQSNTDQVRRFVPCEQASLSLQPCPPREKGEVAQSKTDPMTLHGTTWLSENGYSVNGYLVVGFEVGRSVIKRNLRDLPEWKGLVALMRGTNVQWKIQGLSDCSGSKDLNEGIRRARAEAIYNLLPEDARKNVVSRESVPLYECITGNQRKVDRTVNRSVLIEQVGRTVDIDPAEEDVIEPNLPKFVCGPDVTRQVAEAVTLARSTFNGWGHSQRVDGCDALISLQGLGRRKKGGGGRGNFVAGCSWDIWELHNNDWINKRFQPICATTGAKPGCGESVQIDDDCHHAGAVNYVIFGTMFRLCSENVSHDFYFDFSKSNMKALVDIRKGSGGSGLATPVPNFKGSLAWAKAGYEGWPAVSSPPGDLNHCVPMCPLPYVGASPGPDGWGDPFDIHWHPHRSRYTCP
jgi:hypothetical protein